MYICWCFLISCLYIFNFGYLSFIHLKFTWARIWGSVVIFRSQKGSVSRKVWETLLLVIQSHILSIIVTTASFRLLWSVWLMEHMVTNPSVLNVIYFLEQKHIWLWTNVQFIVCVGGMVNSHPLCVLSDVT